MPRYEYSEGSSNKFWEIELDGDSFTTTYGRIGTDGKTTIKEYDSEEKAEKEYDKLIAQKVKKGYELVDGDGGAAPKPAAKKKGGAGAGGAAPSTPKQKVAKKKVAKKAAAPKAAAGGAQRYELVEGKSSKFWEIQLDGTSFTTTYGRIGTDGKTTIKEYDSEEKAEKEYEKIIAQKVKKGYELVS